MNKSELWNVSRNHVWFRAIFFRYKCKCQLQQLHGASGQVKLASRSLPQA